MNYELEPMDESELGNRPSRFEGHDWRGNDFSRAYSSERRKVTLDSGIMQSVLMAVLAVIVAVVVFF